MDATIRIPCKGEGQLKLSFHSWILFKYK
jgi:hypothetical protein